MNLFFQESKVDYKNYSFPYQVWAEIENGEAIDEVLEKGFLPQSSKIKEERHLFYLARSLRYDLSKFSWDKKRRYEQRKFSNANYSISFNSAPKSKESFEYYWNLANPWMKASLGEAYLSKDRFHYIWNKPFLNTLLEIKKGEERVAFSLINKGESSSHYWYCFYNSKTGIDSGLGIMAMGCFLEWAKDSSQRFAYVGTAYKKKAAYKMKGAKGIEFFDGSNWNSNKEVLKNLQYKDGK